MARTKTVYPTDSIPHLWAHQTQDSARNPQGNLYFDGDTIYSYGRHFPIARHVEFRGRQCVFVTTGKWSTTTAGHVRAVRMSIPNQVQTWFVENPLHDVPAVIVDRKFSIGQLRRELADSKSVDDRIQLYRKLVSAVHELNKFVEFFGFKPKYKMGLPKWEAHILAAESARRLAKIEAKRQTEQQREFERAQERRRLLELEAPALIEAWRNGAPHNLAHRLWELPTMLRIRGEMVETSRGATFPVDHAKRALPIVQKLLAGGQQFRANGQQIRLGHFSIDSIDQSGTVRAGCHTVERSEIERLIAQLS